MKRLGVVLLIVLLLLVVADLFARRAAENAAAKLIDRRIAQKVEPDVRFGDFPFLLSLLTGHFDEIAIDVPSVSEGKLVVQDTHLTLFDVDIDAFEVLGGGGDLRARSLRGQGHITEATLNRIISAEAPDLRTDVERGRVLVSRDGMSVPATAVIAGNRVLLRAGDVFGPFEIPLPELLPEVRFTSLRAKQDRLVLGVHASRFRLNT